MNAIRAPWSHASFLVYLGGLTILLAIAVLLGTESQEHGAGVFVLWAAAVFAVLAALAFLARRSGHLITAGLLALSAVASFVVFLGALLDWFGWFPDTQHAFKGFRFWLLVLELAAVVASAVALRLFRFPLLIFAIGATTWFFVTDLISGGGDWSAIVTIAFGLILLTVAVSFDTGGSRIYGFWLHVVSGLTIGGGLLWFFHEGDWDWIAIAIAGLLYLMLGDRLLRSSWVVLGAWGLLQTTSHFAAKWSDVSIYLGLIYLFPFNYDEAYGEVHKHQWIGPLLFGVTGIVFIGIALLLARRRRDAIPAAELL
jgi:hypothetical protein